MQPIRIGIIGVGMIARKQHIPAILANPAYALACVCSPDSQVEGLANFLSTEAMLSQMRDLDAVAICTPPQAHYAAAKIALRHGKHVLLEKPPCTTLSQLSHLAAMAAAQNLSLYATWHSRHAPGVAPALSALRGRRLRHGRITWKEDVRIWHPGQRWIWQSGGFGVLDPGINALSLLTHLVDDPIHPESAVLYIPENCDTPIAARVSLKCESGAVIDVELDFAHRGTEAWEIDFDTDLGPVKLSGGGNALSVDDIPIRQGDGLRSEYTSIYAHFADLVKERRSEVDARPLQLVADIFLLGKRVTVAPFIDSGSATHASSAPGVS
jgi:predicted dehydrogenase